MPGRKACMLMNEEELLSEEPFPSSKPPTNHTAAVSEEGPKVAKFLDR